MRKEVWLAIFAGIFLGLIIGFGVWRINSTFKPNSSSTPKATLTSDPQGNLGLAIAKPIDDGVLLASPALISGITSANSWVVISGSARDYIFKSDEKGTFQYGVDLLGGVNQFVVTSIEKEGNLVSKNLRLIFSTQLTIPEPSLSPSPSPSGTTKEASEDSEIRQRVKEKVEDVLNNPQAYLGTVTDISGETIQLKSDAGEIKQVAVQIDNLTVIKSGSVDKEVKFADIALGDYLVAMGYRSGNHVLNAKRILVISPPPVPTRKVFFGKIKNVNKGEIVLDGLDTRILISSATKYTTTKTDGTTANLKLANLTENNLIIVSGDTLKDKFTARRIHLVESNPQ